MRRLAGCLIMVLILVGIVAAILVFGLIDMPFDLPFGNTIGSLPTHTPAPGTVSNTVPITSTDNCEAVASASGIIVDAKQNRGKHNKATLPNGRPFPAKAPLTVSPPNRPVADQVLIQFTNGSSQQERNDYIRLLNGRARKSIDKLNTFVVTVAPGTDITNLPESPIVVLIEPDYIAGATQTVQPNDPRYAEQWALPVMGVPEAWAALPDGSATITVAVIDSGICGSHPDLIGRIVTGYDFVDEDNDPSDVFGHGCSVAGVIAATRNNNEGIAGVAPNVSIMPLRVLDSAGLGNYSDIAAAIVYATDNGAQIINLSLAGAQYSQIMADAVNYAASRGLMIIAAVGNNGLEAIRYPAALPAVVAVGSIDPDLQRSDFSNFGSYVDILAPGRDILTTSINGSYEIVSGTSFAAPQVAGIAAMTRVFNIPLNTENGAVFVYPPDNLPNCP